MYGTELYIAIVIGTILSLIYTEVTGILPAGVVVPGYLALIFDRPYMLLLVLVISCLTYLVVTKFVSKWVILYGRRKFVVMVAMAVIIKLALDNLIPLVQYEVYEITGIGVIVPGIIANTIQKQGLTHTLLSTMFVSGLTFLIIFGYNIYA